MYVSMYVCMHVRMYLCNVCMYVRMYYVPMYVRNVCITYVRNVCM